MNGTGLVGLIADSHDNRDAIAEAVEFFNERGVDLVLHAGDLVAPFTFKDFSKLRCKMIAVFGNNDGERLGLHHTCGRVGEIGLGPPRVQCGGRDFLLMHEPLVIDDLKESNKLDVVVYGHTHEVNVQEGRPLIVNPGEAGGWLTGKRTVAVLELDTLNVEIVNLS